MTSVFSRVKIKKNAQYQTNIPPLIAKQKARPFQAFRKNDENNYHLKNMCIFKTRSLNNFR